MMFLKPAVLLGLVASTCATPIPQGSSTDLTKRLAEVEEAVYSLIDNKREADVDFAATYNLLETRAKVKDVVCPDNKVTYTADTIKARLSYATSLDNPDKYGNTENNKQLFPTSDQLYKVSLDNVARAVFSRDAKKNYNYRGTIEHDKGTGNGFHKC